MARKDKFIIGAMSQTKLVVRMDGKDELIIISSFDGRFHRTAKFKGKPLMIFWDDPNEFQKERGIEYLTNFFNEQFSDNPNVAHAFIADKNYPNAGDIIKVLRRKDNKVSQIGAKKMPNMPNIESGELVMFKLAVIVNDNGKKKWKYIFADTIANEDGELCKYLSFEQLLVRFRAFRSDMLKQKGVTLEPIGQLYGNAIAIYDKQNSDMPPMAWLDTKTTIPYYHKTNRPLKIYQKITEWDISTI